MSIRDFIRIVETSGGFHALTRTEAFKAWFHGSQIVDERGEPLVVWHGLKQPLTHLDTLNKRVLFSPSFGSFDVTKQIEPGAWFSPQEQVARHYGHTAPFFLRALNPVREESPLSAPPAGHDAIYRTRSNRSQIWDAWEIAVFESQQIKLAFDLTDPALKAL